MVLWHALGWRIGLFARSDRLDDQRDSRILHPLVAKLVDGNNMVFERSRLPRKIAVGIRRLVSVLDSFGINVVHLREAIANLPRFVKDLRRYAERSKQSLEFPLRLRELDLHLTDASLPAGRTRGHYFYQDLWAARKIYVRRPSRHVDVGSRIDGFVAHLLTFMEVEVIDIRKRPSDVPGLVFVEGDGTELSSFDDDSVESLSSLHAVEHFGLGRYGDPVDPEAWQRATRALVRVLSPGGYLYFSVPIGLQRLRFNSERIFAPETIVEAFAELSLESFAVIDDAGELRSASLGEDFSHATYSCGLFEFRK